MASPNRLERQFNVDEPNKVWVTDMTYIRTHEGWLYFAVVLALFSRQVIGWSMKSRMSSGLAIDALLMAGSDDSFRPGQPVQQLELAVLPKGQQPDQQHDSTR